jgi:hypothetical protein
MYGLREEGPDNTVHPHSTLGQPSKQSQDRKPNPPRFDKYNLEQVQTWHGVTCFEVLHGLLSAARRLRKSADRKLLNFNRRCRVPEARTMQRQHFMGPLPLLPHQFRLPKRDCGICNMKCPNLEWRVTEMHADVDKVTHARCNVQN